MLGGLNSPSSALNRLSALNNVVLLVRAAYFTPRDDHGFVFSIKDAGRLVEQNRKKVTICRQLEPFL